MHVSDVVAQTEFSHKEKVRKELYRSAASKVLLICLEEGQKVEPCVMAAEVLFYVVEGSGRITAGSSTVPVHQGSLVVVPPGLERQIEAGPRMVVLAVQALARS